MGYCAPKWISPYTYGKFLNHYRALAGVQADSILVQTRIEDALTVDFSVVDGRISWVYLAPGTITGSQTSGRPLPFKVEIRDAAGMVVDAVVVHLNDPYQVVGDRELHLSAAVPLRPDGHSVSIVNGSTELWANQTAPTA